MYVSSGLTGRNVLENSETLAHALKLEDGGSLLISVSAQHLPKAPPRSLFGLFDHAKLREMMWEIAQEEPRRIYSSRVKESVLKVAEVVLSDAFQGVYELENDGLKAACLQFVEQFLVKITQNGAMKELFAGSIEG